MISVLSVNILLNLSVYTAKGVTDTVEIEEDYYSSCVNSIDVYPFEE